jgi:hypothetical protein
MKTLTLGAGTAASLRITVEAGEVRLSGSQGSGQIALSYGYFADGQEVLQDASMDPAFHLDGPSAIALSQTPDQASRARQAHAHIRALLDLPAHMSLGQSRLDSGTIAVKGIHGVELELISGTLDSDGNTGPYAVSAKAGTLHVARPASAFHHQLAVQAGTIVLKAGALLPFVSAEVEQGVIQGGQGRLDRAGMAGWKLTPLNSDPRSSVNCRAGAGSIMIG